MAKGRKTGGGSRKGIPNKRTLLFEEVAERIGDVSGTFQALLRSDDEQVKLGALRLYCEYAFSKPKQVVEHSGTIFELGEVEQSKQNGDSGELVN